MIIFKKEAEILSKINNFREKGLKIGFVPTMGALHEGHISLIYKCKSENDIAVCSIFVNPTQFNNPEDLVNYPVSVENDIDMLEAAGCDILFLPTINEVYPVGFQKKHYDLGLLEHILEGKYRPGHFQGVCLVVERLLRIIPSDILYLGEKDYQQCRVIERMIELTGLPVRMVISPTIREASGLAMSSRNRRLNAIDKVNALTIINTMQFIQSGLVAGPLEELLQAASQQLMDKGFEIDYVAITDNQLNQVTEWDGKTLLRVLVAATINSIRLIDNMAIN